MPRTLLVEDKEPIAHRTVKVVDSHNLKGVGSKTPVSPARRRCTSGDV